MGTILGLSAGSYLLGFWFSCGLMVIIHAISLYVSAETMAVIIGTIVGFTVGIIWAPQGWLPVIMSVVGGAVGFVLKKRSKKNS